MNVTQANNISETVKELREGVYKTEEFKDRFNKELKKSICAIDTEYTPDELGGWNVKATINRDKAITKGIISQESELYVEKVKEALRKSIKTYYLDNSEVAMPSILLNNDPLASSVANVIVSGISSITIKI